jgi:hypothetical protein
VVSGVAPKRPTLIAGFEYQPAGDTSCTTQKRVSRGTLVAVGEPLVEAETGTRKLQSPSESDTQVVQAQSAL